MDLNLQMENTEGKTRGASALQLGEQGLATGLVVATYHYNHARTRCTSLNVISNHCHLNIFFPRSSHYFSHHVVPLGM